MTFVATRASIPLTTTNNMQTQTSHSTLLTPQSRIYVAGHRGLVGSAIIRKLQAEGYQHYHPHS